MSNSNIMVKFLGFCLSINILLTLWIKSFLLSDSLAFIKATHISISSFLSFKKTLLNQACVFNALKLFNLSIYKVSHQRVSQMKTNEVNINLTQRSFANG